MGFLNSCWEVLLQVTTYAQSLGLGHDIYQQPLPLPNHAHGPALVPAAGVSFLPQGSEGGFTCEYPTLTGYEACNSARDRTCWLKPANGKGFVYDIHTDYERYGPQGKTREYWLNVSTQAIAPDGYVKLLGQVFNNSYPGPNIQACWGDELIIHVTNLIPDLGTTVHWHGIRQLHTNQQDGVNGVTQCPIAYNQTYTYRFNVTQYGHTWYHSHYQTQYSDGVMGPLTLYGPSSASYDETSTPILINDWTHQNTSVAFRQELAGGIPVMDDILLGGKGNFRCSDLDPLCCNSCSNVTRGPNPQPKCPTNVPLDQRVDPQFCCTPSEHCIKTVNGTQTQIGGSTFTLSFVKGKRYLLKLINSSAESMFIFMIDGHDFQVVATDLVPIQTYTTDSLFIGIGQRYQILVTANSKTPSADGNYWIRTRVARGCGTVAQADETTGIVRYDSSSTNTPSTNSNTGRNLCADELPENLQPVVPWNVSDLQGNQSDYTFQADIDTTVTHHAFRWDLTDTPLYLNYSNPSILNTLNQTFLNDPFQAMIKYNFSTGYVYLIVDGANLPGLQQKTPAPAAHPIHLHGHDFVILAQTNETFNGTVPAFDPINPTRRDVALLYGGGYLALAFKPDNPGLWLVHCHIAWHASSGLALQVLERQEEILPTIGSLQATQNTCQGWRHMGLQFDQDDSGI